MGLPDSLLGLPDSLLGLPGFYRLERQDPTNIDVFTPLCTSLFNPVSCVLSNNILTTPIQVHCCLSETLAPVLTKAAQAVPPTQSMVRRQTAHLSDTTPSTPSLDKVCFQDWPSENHCEIQTCNNTTSMSVALCCLYRQRRNLHTSAQKTLTTRVRNVQCLVCCSPTKKACVNINLAVMVSRGMVWQGRGEHLFDY